MYPRENGCRLMVRGRWILRKWNSWVWNVWNMWPWCWWRVASGNDWDILESNSVWNAIYVPTRVIWNITFVTYKPCNTSHNNNNDNRREDETAVFKFRSS